MNACEENLMLFIRDVRRDGNTVCMRWLCVVFLLFVAGCGGSTDTARTAEQGTVTTVVPNLTSPEIVFLGDSITEEGTFLTVIGKAAGAQAVNAGHSGQAAIAQIVELVVQFAIGTHLR